MPNGSDRITSHALQELQPTKTVDDPEIKAWLSLPVKSKKKGGGKKKKGEFHIKVAHGAYRLLKVTKAVDDFDHVFEFQESVLRKVKVKLSQWTKHQMVVPKDDEKSGHFSM